MKVRKLKIDGRSNFYFCVGKPETRLTDNSGLGLEVHKTGQLIFVSKKIAESDIYFVDI